jgi:hypothetical protein
MVFTRAQSQVALDHILKNVLVLTDDSPLIKALNEEGYTDIEDVITISQADMDLLSYSMPSDPHDPASPSVNVPVPKHLKSKLKLLQHYVAHRVIQGNPLSNDWISLTEEEFNIYRTTSAILTVIGYNNSPSIAPVPSKPPESPRLKDPISEFRKGIKRDASLYTVYKDEKQWDSWQRSTIALARAQNVEDILDSTYIPSNQDEADLFTEKKKFMYAVFERTLQTDQGKAFVRAHEYDFDAQAIYKDLVEYSIKSTKASLDSARTLAYITTARLGDGNWRGPTRSFILHWQEDVRLYEKLVPLSDHIPDSVKRSMLENAVGPIDMLRAVKDQADQMKVTRGTDLTYVEYCKLILSAAANYDARSSSTRKDVHPKRTIYFHDTDNVDPTDVEPPDDYTPYDIDADVDVIAANVTKQANVSPRIPLSQWKELSSTTKTTWLSIPDRDKALILQGHNTTSTSGSSTKRHTPMRAANVHTTGDSVDCLPSASDDDAVTVLPDESTDLIAMVTKRQPSKTTKARSDAPPSDIRKLLSSDNKRQPSKSPSPVDQEIHVNGHTYRLINFNIIYNISTLSHTTSPGSLVDRGANGGVAGDDVRVIETTLRRVHIQGIDNHQITNIPIVTAGGVVNSQRGPVIAILHQYAYTGKGRSIHSSCQLESYNNKVND